MKQFEATLQIAVGILLALSIFWLVLGNDSIQGMIR
jgi:hypothetical protein